MKCVILYTDDCEIVSEADGFDIPCVVKIADGNERVSFQSSARVPFASSSNQMRTAVVNQMMQAAAGAGKPGLVAGDCTVIGSVS